MGYYAKADGEIRISKLFLSKEGKVVTNYLNDYHMNKQIEEVTCDGNYYLEIDFYDRYHEEEWDHILDIVTPFTISGSIDFRGEDDEHWREVFDPEAKKWQRESGEILYDSELKEKERNVTNSLIQGLTSPEGIGQIIDIFEDFLEEKGVKIENPEKQDAIYQGEDPEGLAIIYGSDYDMLATALREHFAGYTEGIFK